MADRGAVIPEVVFIMGKFSVWAREFTLREVASFTPNVHRHVRRRRRLGSSTLATAAVSGSVLHQVFFKRFEIDKRPVSVAVSFISAYFGLASFLNLYANVPGAPKRHGLVWALSVAFLTQSTFLVSLWTNMLVYRGFFHPLKNFPGPFGAKFSKFWALNQVLKSKIKWYHEGFTSSLLARIGRNEGKSVVINDLSIHYNYDVMSALAFGEEMGFVTGEVDDAANEILQNIQNGVDAIGLLLHVPWLMTTLTTFSWAIGPMRKWNEWSKDQAERRKRVCLISADSGTMGRGKRC